MTDRFLPAERPLVKFIVCSFQFKRIFLFILILVGLPSFVSAESTHTTLDHREADTVPNLIDPKLPTCQNTFSILNGVFWCYTHCMNSLGQYVGGNLTVMKNDNSHEAMMKCQSGQILDPSD
jgi:hypothetical protein